MKRRSIALAGSAALCFLLLFTITAWNQSAPTKPTERDTIPRSKKIRNPDDVLREIERAEQQLDAELKRPLAPLPPQDFSKMKAELDQAIQELNSDKMRIHMEQAEKELRKALDELDRTKLKLEEEGHLSKVDIEKIRKDIQAELKEVNVSMEKVNMEELKKELQQLRDEELPRIQKELEAQRPQIENAMNEARQELKKAKAEMEAYKNFVDGLHADGLINKDGEYTIEHKGGVLKINERVQPADVYNKYRSFLEKEKDFKIKKTSEDFNIHKD